MEKARKTVQEFKEGIEPRRRVWRGWLIDYERTGSARVSPENVVGKYLKPGERSGYVYVRLDRGESGQSSGDVIQAFARIRPTPGWAVWVGTTPYREWEYTVLEVDTEAMGGEIAGQPILEHHHETHEWGDPSGSDDVVWPRFLQLADFGVHPWSGLTVRVNTGTYDPSGTRQQLPQLSTIDLSSYVPSTGQRYVLIAMSPTGTFEVVPGQVEGFLTLEDIPPVPSDCHWQLAAVRLRAGDTEIENTPQRQRILDLRFASMGFAKCGLPTGTHAPVTLTSDLDDNLLGLSGQELDLDAQPSGSLVFAAPEGGGKPSFIQLTNPYIPDIHDHYPGSIELEDLEADVATQAELDAHVAAADPHPVYLLADGSRVGATANNQEFTNHVLTDGGFYGGGVAADTTYNLKAYHNGGAGGSNTRGIDVRIDKAFTGNETDYDIALRLYVADSYYAELAGQNAGYLMGLHSTTYVGSSHAGFLATLRGVHIAYGSYTGAGGSVTEAIGLYIYPNQGGTTIFTTAYGIQIGDVTDLAAGAFSIYSAGGKMQHQGHIGIGASPSAPLDIFYNVSQMIELDRTDHGDINTRYNIGVSVTGTIDYMWLGPTSDQDALVITELGNVGIQKTDPAYVLDIESAGSNRIHLTTTTANTIPQVSLENDAYEWAVRVNGGDADQLDIRNVTDGANVLTIETGAVADTLVLTSLGLESVNGLYLNGVTANAYYSVMAQQDGGIGASRRVYYGKINKTFTSNQTVYDIGIYFDNSSGYLVNSGFTQSGYLIGALIATYAGASHAGTIATMRGAEFRIGSNATAAGAVTTLEGIYINAVQSGTTTYTTVRGLNIDDMTTLDSGAYSIYSTGGKMYHAGDVGIGTNAPAQALHVMDGAIRISHSSSSPLLQLYDDSDNDWFRFAFARASDYLRVDSNSLDGIMYWTKAGRVGINVGSPSAMLDITQGSASGAIPPLKLRQDDVDQPLIYFRGTAANGNLDRSIVDDDDVTVGSRDGWIMVYVEDIGNQITDQKYFVPVYTLS